MYNSQKRYLQGLWTGAGDHYQHITIADPNTPTSIGYDYHEVCMYSVFSMSIGGFRGGHSLPPVSEIKGGVPDPYLDFYKVITPKAFDLEPILLIS